MREDYGSLLPELIDMPMTPAVIAVSHQAIVTAIATWEPRIKISQIQLFLIKQANFLHFVAFFSLIILGMIIACFKLAGDF